MESTSGVCTPNTYVKSAKNRGEILVPVVFELWSLEEPEAFRPKRCPKMRFFCFFEVLWGWKEEERSWFGSNRYFGSLNTSIFTWFFCKFDIGGWKIEKNKSHQNRCFFVVFWDREKEERSWFGSKLYFYSLKTSVSTWFISKCTILHYFWSKAAEKKTKTYPGLCGHQNDD